MAVAALAEAVVLLDEEEGARGVWTRRGQEVWEMGRLRERMRWEFSREGEHGDLVEEARGDEEGSEVELVYVELMLGSE